MIQINNNDTPIIAAQKIIHGTKPSNPTPAMRAIAKALTGRDADDVTDIDMFDDAEIREIADYLLTYCKYHGGEES